MILVAWRWVKARAKYVAAAFGVLVAFVIGVFVARRTKEPTPRLSREDLHAEAKAVIAEGEIRKIIAVRGHEAAVVRAQLQYERDKASLDEAQRQQAMKLIDDPVELSRFLADAGARARLRRTRPS